MDFEQLAHRIINNDDDDSWVTQDFRKAWIDILRQLIAYDGEYHSALHGYIYASWKGEKSDRLMSNPQPPKMEYYSRENAWDILHDINLGDVEIPKSLLGVLEPPTEWLSQFVATPEE